MNQDSLPIWAFFVGTILIVLISHGVGHALGVIAHRNSEDEKEAPVSSVAGAVLGLTAFILVFSFGIVAERYDARKGLVRADASAIRTAYLRAAFLPEPDRAESRRLLKGYVEKRLDFARMVTDKQQDISPLLAETDRTHRRLWDIAVANAERDMNSDVAALYIESLNELIEVHAVRLAIGVRTRLPLAIWAVLYGLTILGTVSMGYHAGIAGSKRTKATLVLALSFGMVITLIASLERPQGFIKVTQQPLADLASFMAEEQRPRPQTPD